MDARACMLALSAVLGGLAAIGGAAQAETCQEYVMGRALEAETNLTSSAARQYGIATDPSEPFRTRYFRIKEAMATRAKDLPPDPRWRLAGHDLIFNCQVPQISVAGQNEALLESGRTFDCTRKAYSCALKKLQSPSPGSCQQVLNDCSRENPIPQFQAVSVPQHGGAPTQRAQPSPTSAPQGQGQTAKPSGVSSSGNPQPQKAPANRPSDVTGTEKPTAKLEEIAPQGKPAADSGISGLGNLKGVPQGPAKPEVETPAQKQQREFFDDIFKTQRNAPPPSGPSGAGAGSKEGGVRLNVESEGRPEDLDRNDVLKLKRKPGT